MGRRFTRAQPAPPTRAFLPCSILNRVRTSHPPSPHAALTLGASSRRFARPEAALRPQRGARRTVALHPGGDCRRELRACTHLRSPARRGEQRRRRWRFTTDDLPHDAILREELRVDKAAHDEPLLEEKRGRGVLPASDARAELVALRKAQLATMPYGLRSDYDVRLKTFQRIPKPKCREV